MPVPSAQARRGRLFLVLCMTLLIAACGSPSTSAPGNSQLNVVIPSGSSTSGPGAPSSFDIEVVEYTINCTGADFDPTSDPDIDSGPTLDQDVSFSGALEVLDTASGGVDTQDFGPDLTEVYVWQGFMDIPADHACTVQLRARDGDGEVICTATEGFNVGADATVKVNVLMICDISYQAPVGMVDLDGDFSFNIGNYCPDLFVLNCVDPDVEETLVVPGVGAFVYSGCQVRFRDADSTCGANCDPQDCSDVTPAGINCIPGPDPGQPTTTVTCVSDGAPFLCAIPGPLFGTACTPAPGDTCFDASGGVGCVPTSVMNCGGGTIDASCTYTGDTLGSPGDAPPVPLAVGPGGFLVGCTLADNDGNPFTPPVPLSGQTVTCTAVTTDGDVDCDKIKTVEVLCFGVPPCQLAGPAFCDDGNECTSNVCDDSSGSAVCSNPSLADGTSCTSLPPPAVCLGGVCTGTCPICPGSCDDGNECTIDLCDDTGPDCGCSSEPNTGASCAGNTGTCNASGACVDNCVGADCSDGNECTDDVCTSGGGGFTCTNPNNDTNSCTTCGGGNCFCFSALCLFSCLPPVQDAPGIPMACRNSFNQAVSTFPIDLLNVTADACLISGDAVNFDIEPTIALDTAFLQAAAETLCDLGTLLTQADVTSAQVSIDAIAGATCTEQLSVLSPVPQTVVIDITLVSGSCGAGGVVVVNSGIALPLSSVTLPCTLGTFGSEVQICSTGQIPLNITLASPAPPPAYQETYVGVSVGGGAIQVAFACNTSSTTSPAPGTTVSCTAPNPTGACAALPPGNVGETPFPVSDCDFGDGFPGTCTTVPVGVDPAAVCATFTVE